jgi:hypothetical protein
MDADVFYGLWVGNAGVWCFFLCQVTRVNNLTTKVQICYDVNVGSISSQKDLAVMYDPIDERLGGSRSNREPEQRGVIAGISVLEREKGQINAVDLYQIARLVNKPIDYFLVT